MPVTKSLEPIFLETFKNDAPATTVNILFRTKILFKNRCFLFVVSSSAQRREYDNTIGTVDNYKIQITKIAVLHDVALLPRKLPPRTADTPLETSLLRAASGCFYVFCDTEISLSLLFLEYLSNFPEIGSVWKSTCRITIPRRNEGLPYRSERIVQRNVRNVIPMFVGFFHLE